ncbi:MAG: ATP-dependent Clp protease proteolytic subunit [Planctomycetota bacterium]|nr:ATP-dependent Clp protease proteolytic subunit [Planctomycetota bacterium]
MQRKGGFWRGWVALGLGVVAILFLVAQGADPKAEEGPSWSDVAGEIAEATLDKIIDATAWAAPVRYEDPLLKRRVIVVSGEINAATGRQVCSQLLHLDRFSNEPIHVYVTSDGGWGANAYAITGVMQTLGSPVHTYAAGDCSSAGALIVAAGTVRQALPDSIIMIHPTVDADDDTEEFSFDRTDRERDERFWKRHAKLPQAWFPFKADRSYYLHGSKALEFGIVDAVLPSKRPEPK